MAGSAGSMIPQDEPLAYRVVRGGLWVALSSYFNLGFGFVANLALTRLLAPEHFGIFALGMFFFALLNLRPKVSLGAALAQRRDMSGELVGTHLTLDATAGVLSLLLAAACVPLFRWLGYEPAVGWTVLALAGVGVSDGLMGTAWVLLDRDLQFARTSLVSSLAFPFSYVPAFWLALRGGGYWALLAQNATYALLLLLGMWWAARRTPLEAWRVSWRFDRGIASQLIRFGGMVGLATVAAMLVGQFDNFLVGTFVGVGTLGFYDRAYRIAQWPSILVSDVVNRAALYTYARLQDEPERLHRTVTMTLWITTALALPLALAIFASAPDLVSLLYGNRWLASAPFLRFLVVYSLARPLLDNAKSLFVAVGQPQRSTIVLACQVLALMVFATPLTIAYGAIGTCIGVGGAFLAGLALTYRYTRRTIPFSLADTLVVPAVAALLAMAAYLLLARLADLNALALVLRVLVKVGFTSGLFWAIALLLRPQEYRERAGYVWRLLRRVA